MEKINKLKELSNKVLEVEKEVNKIEDEVINLEQKRLDEILKIAKETVKFNGILEDDFFNPQIDRREKRFFKDGEETLKGIFINDYIARNGKKYKLILTNKLELIEIVEQNPFVYLTNDYGYTRTIIKRNYDIFNDIPIEEDRNLPEDETLKFDVNDIFESVKEAIEDRLSDLEYRGKKLNKKLDKLIQLKL